MKIEKIVRVIKVNPDLSRGKKGKVRVVERLNLKRGEEKEGYPLLKIKKDKK